MLTYNHSPYLWKSASTMRSRPYINLKFCPCLHRSIPAPPGYSCTVNIIYDHVVVRNSLACPEHSGHPATDNGRLRGHNLNISAYHIRHGAYWLSIQNRVVRGVLAIDKVRVTLCNNQNLYGVWRTRDKRDRPDAWSKKAVPRRSAARLDVHNEPVARLLPARSTKITQIGSRRHELDDIPLVVAREY